ncbi:division/cell wall cluster transcriptional repressor MraZ [Phaeobacter marinintestinus]|uniref:division/cell wall cluster transcriptional repressor MraZ n=1 Tax=Falsiphaeobacter marinintestinus TaxID=1492905 RepID=UPI0011B7057D|nr:division/cell wall cluster transcriptional repressor MraZ [Phaeobacter marinintestinus]
MTVASPSFLGEFCQKIDGKGRMSIPVEFRRVLEENDPSRPAGRTTRMYLVYGSHLKDHLEAYTPKAMDEIVAQVEAMPRGLKRKKAISHFFLSKSQEMEIDKDGRIVMPKDRRAQLGLGEDGGLIQMLGMGEYFQIWNKDVYDAKEADIDASFMDDDDEGEFDPLSWLHDDSAG